MNAQEVRNALNIRWSPEEYAHIDEAPTTADRRGQKLDRLVCSLWESRGFEIEGIEIKVSTSDWQRELKNAGKADWWWKHVHRFWIAAPDPVALKIAKDLPTGWGLLGCAETSCKVVVKAVKHEAAPLPWTAVLGLLRAASGAGFNAIQNAKLQGHREGREAALRSREHQNGDESLRLQFAALREKVAKFEEISGISIAHNWNLAETARATGFLNKCAGNRDLHKRLAAAAREMEAIAREAARLSEDVGKVMAVNSEAA